MILQLARDIGTVASVLDRTPDAKDYRDQRRTLSEWRSRALGIADQLDALTAHAHAQETLQQQLAAQAVSLAFTDELAHKLAAETARLLTLRAQIAVKATEYRKLAQFAPTGTAAAYFDGAVAAFDTCETLLQGDPAPAETPETDEDNWRLVKAGEVAPLKGTHGSWVETDHPAVIACMGTEQTPCQEHGCQYQTRQSGAPETKKDEPRSVSAQPSTIGPLASPRNPGGWDDGP